MVAAGGGCPLVFPKSPLHLLGDTGWHTNAQRLNEPLLLCCEKHLKEAEHRRGVEADAALAQP